ncbi:hypothetical protein [Streptomyces flavofungini]|uniref:hypothetical protein n=1 Tax=Streptomyces flavofungini TaxID=68200 RepID=UPI0034DFBB7F
MNRRHIRMGAITALTALTLGVTGTTAAQAATPREAAPAASITTDFEPEFELGSDASFLAYLDSAEGQELLSEEGLTKAQVTESTGDRSASGWLDGLKKKALKKAYKALPKQWRDKMSDWAKHGKSYFKGKWNSLPGWVKKTLTVGGSISVSNVIDWLIDIIL